MPEPPLTGEFLRELRDLLKRLRESDAEPLSRDELMVALGVVSEAVTHYCDATFARAMVMVHDAGAGLGPGKSREARRQLHQAVQAFGGQESEFRERAYRAFRLMESVDARAAGQARSLFESAVRAERLLLSASLEADDNHVNGMILNLHELIDLIGAGSDIRASYRMKVCLLGEGAVGKSSLIRRFVHGSFGEGYQQTIGTRISHRELTVPGPHEVGVAKVDMAVWDIMGHERLGRLMQSYLLGAQGGLLVYSLVDPESLRALGRWMEMVRRTTGPVPTVTLANKADLKPRQAVDKDVAKASAEREQEILVTSAKTGANVELAFSRLARRVIESMTQPGGKAGRPSKK